MEDPGDLRRIAVIGAGPAGRDFAFRCLHAGFEVILEDVMPSRLRSAEQTLASDSQAGALRVAATVEAAVRDADLVIDFVPDELESKLEIFSMLDRMAPPRTILCTPTNSLSIADLASCTYRPQLSFALRFQCSDSVDLIRTSRSSAEAVRAVEEWLNAIGYNITVVIDPAESGLPNR